MFFFYYHQLAGRTLIIIKCRLNNERIGGVKKGATKLFIFTDFTTILEVNKNKSYSLFMLTPV